MHLYICCKTLSDERVLFIKATTSHIFNVMPKVSILPANKINPSLPSVFAIFSCFVIYSLISFAKSLFLRLIHNTLYFLRILSSFISSSKHFEISLILSLGRNQICVKGVRVSLSEHIFKIRENIDLSPFLKSTSLFEPEIKRNTVFTSFSN